VKISKPQSVTGVLEYDPALRFTPGGHPVSNFILVNHQTGERTDCAMWREMAEEFIDAYDAENRMKVLTVWGSRKTRAYKDRNDVVRQVETFNVTRYEFQ